MISPTHITSWLLLTTLRLWSWQSWCLVRQDVWQRVRKNCSDRTLQALYLYKRRVVCVHYCVPNTGCKDNRNPIRGNKSVTNWVHGLQRTNGEEQDKSKYKAKYRNSAFPAKVKNGLRQTTGIPHQQCAGTIQSSQAPVQEGTGYPEHQIFVWLIVTHHDSWWLDNITHC